MWETKNIVNESKSTFQNQNWRCTKRNEDSAESSSLALRTSHLTHDFFPCSLKYELQQFHLFYERTNVTEDLETKQVEAKDRQSKGADTVAASVR